MIFNGGTSRIDTEHLHHCAEQIARYCSLLTDHKRTIFSLKASNGQKLSVARLADDILRLEQLLSSCEADLHFCEQRLHIAAENYYTIERANQERFLNHQPVQQWSSTAFNTTIKELGDTQIPQNYSDIAQNIKEAYSDPATLAIQKITTPEGKNSWIVYIPGLQDKNPFFNHDNPHDIDSCMKGFKGEDSDHKKAIRDSMKTAGIAPNDQVLLAGHSLGGISSIGLLNDPRVMKNYSIAGVITMGSPIEHLHIPQKVPVLSLNNEKDPVHQLDSPFKRHQSSPQLGSALHSSVSFTPPSGNEFNDHFMPDYIHSAKQLDTSNDPSLKVMNAVLSSVAPFGAKATTTHYTNKRKKKRKS
ncbi:MAG: hypothetical protein QM632_02705 [Micrococcaceae bacterium]